MPHRAAADQEFEVFVANAACPPPKAPPKISLVRDRRGLPPAAPVEKHTDHFAFRFWLADLSSNLVILPYVPEGAFASDL